ncbi:sensor histidine kinase, partial [Clostridium perfringens]|nr:sensor histidine kinase [Clostridium perfringens]
LANSYCYKHLYKDLQIKRELEINAQYQYVIEELLDKFREDEHEYKNHLNTLNAMVALSDDYELKSNVSEYIMNIKEQEKYSRLKYIKSTILKAILYNKIIVCEEKGIKFTYDVICDFDEAPLDNTEQTILLNNLLNNAIEAVEMLSKKYINLKIVQGVKYEVMVENNLGENVIINQSEMFKKGMSSKGKGRGFGLYNIKKIVERYKGTIQLSTNKSFFRIQVTI